MILYKPIHATFYFRNGEVLREYITSVFASELIKFEPFLEPNNEPADDVMTIYIDTNDNGRLYRRIIKISELRKIDIPGLYRWC